MRDVAAGGRVGGTHTKGDDMPETAKSKPTMSAKPQPVDEPKQQPQGPDQVVEGAEHVVGTDERRHQPIGYHDSMSGRPVDERGYFTDGDDGPIPADRIVADDWPDHEKHSK